MLMGSVLDTRMISTTPRSLRELERLRALLDSAEGVPLFGAGSGAYDVLATWTGAGSRAGEILVAIARCLGREPEVGATVLIEGLPGVGKTHLLLCLAAVLCFPDVRNALAEMWGFSGDDRDAILNLPRAVVIPVPLDEYRGQAEGLEEIFFAAAEATLARLGYAGDLALSSTSYALRAAEQLLPAYSEELDTEARAAGYETWDALSSADPVAAARIIEEMAAAAGLPTPLLPSRSERLAMLMEAVPPDTAVVWLVDDLFEFLGAAGPKGSRDDLSFLEFIAQRSRITAISVVAAGSSGLPTRGVEERSLLFDETFTLAPRDLRPVMKSAWRAPEAVEDAVRSAVGYLRRAWPDLASDEEELVEAYPFEPLTLRLAEKAGARALRVGNFGVRVLRELGDAIAERPAWQLINAREAAGILVRAARGGHEAQTIDEIISFFRQRAEQLWPGAPEVVGDVIRCLVCAQLAGEVLTAAEVSQALGIDARGQPYLTPRDAEHLLGALAQAGPYVRRIARNGEAGYVVLWRLPARDQARREFERIKQAVSPSDPQIARVLASVLASDRSPIADVASGATIEVRWRNSVRFVWVETADARTLSPQRLAELCARVESRDEPESAALLLAVPLARRAQVEAWRKVIEPLQGRPGAGGIVLWLPRELTAHELEPFRNLVACTMASQVGGTLGAELAEIVDEERTIAEAEAMGVLAAAYFDGQIISGRGVDVDASALARVTGDWAAAIELGVSAALDRVHPDFAAIAPSREIIGRDPVDLIYEEVIRPGVCKVDAGNAAFSWAEAVLAPLGLIVRDEEVCRLSAHASPVARAILDILWARDTTPPHALGRKIDCAEAAKVMFKSSLGLPPELFELSIAALCRLGYLVPFDDHDRPQVVDNIPAPFAAAVRWVARAPLLGPTQWQTVGRLLRAIGHHGVIAPGHEGQQSAWDSLVAARRHWLDLIQHLRERLGELWEALDQGPEQWSETLEELDAAEQLFRMIDPSQPAALGLSGVAAAVSDVLEREGEGGRLARFLSHL
ncbi:MAG: hypothetical protein H5T86_09530, partial [Armatimonadetes bacterium]|nr:hypothetical protein [Armatimonadota bacterium]